MIIDLPEDLLAMLRARVLGGQFSSIDDAVAESVRLMFGMPVREENRPIAGRPGQGSIGFMSDAAEELDAMVEDAMNHRREESRWKVPIE